MVVYLAGQTAALLDDWTVDGLAGDWAGTKAA